MRHSIERADETLSVEFSWRRTGAWESLKMRATGAARSFIKGSIEEFIAERGWSYGARMGGCSEYSVQHPRWSYWPASAAEFKCDVAALYGPEFAESLSSPSASAFIADGSEVVVGHRTPFAAQDPADLSPNRTFRATLTRRPDWSAPRLRVASLCRSCPSALRCFARGIRIASDSNGWSGLSESNRRPMLGKHPFYH